MPPVKLADCFYESYHKWYTVLPIADEKWHQIVHTCTATKKPDNVIKHQPLTFILLFTATPTFANSEDPDQMASEEAIWSGSTLFVIHFVNLNENIIWYNMIDW